VYFFLLSCFPAFLLSLLFFFFFSRVLCASVVNLLRRKKHATTHTQPIRNRIKGHRRIRAGDLIPHELNFRLHPDLQKDLDPNMEVDVANCT
jgi:hypothetical protein